MDTINRLTICIFSALYLPSMGGVENFTSNLSKALVNLGHNVVIVTNNSHREAPFEISSEGIEIYRLPCFKLMDARLPIPRFGKTYHEIKSRIKKVNPDYIIINTRFYPLCITAAHFAKKKNIRPIIIEHGSAYLTLNNKLFDSVIKLYEHVFAALLKSYDPVFYGVSQAANNWLSTFHIKPEGVINNSINADTYFENASNRDFRKEFCLSDSSFVVTFIGRLVSEKGVPSIIEAATQLFSLNSNIIFFVAGAGPLAKQIKQYPYNNLIFLGKLSQPDIASLLKASNAFCLPSRSEGFSTSLLEAAACFTSPIITEIGGAIEMIPNQKYGVILNDGKAAEIINCVLYLEKNRNLNSEICLNVGNRVRQKFSWEKTAIKSINACHKANNP